jgi:predicted transcriptional regulator
MATAKEQLSELIKRLPDDSSYDDLVREIAFDLMVKRGLKDSDEGRVVTNDQMHRRIKIWQK